MSNKWYARPVLFVADIDRSVDFYVKQLGFRHPWRYEEEGNFFSVSEQDEASSTGMISKFYSISYPRKLNQSRFNSINNGR